MSSMRCCRRAEAVAIIWLLWVVPSWFPVVPMLLGPTNWNLWNLCECSPLLRYPEAIKPIFRHAYESYQS